MLYTIYIYTHRSNYVHVAILTLSQLFLCIFIFLFYDLVSIVKESSTHYASHISFTKDNYRSII